MGQTDSGREFSDNLKKKKILHDLTQKQEMQFWKIHAMKGLTNLSYLHPNAQVPLNLIEPTLIEEVMFMKISIICRNNFKTGNLAGLTIFLSQELKAISTISRKVAKEKDLDFLINGFIILRKCIHYILSRKNSSPEEFLKHFSCFPQKIDQILKEKSIFHFFLDAIITYLQNSQISFSNLLLHYEIHVLLLILFSTNLYFGIEKDEIDEEEEIYVKEEPRIKENTDTFEQRENEVVIDLNNLEPKARKTKPKKKKSIEDIVRNHHFFLESLFHDFDFSTIYSLLHKLVGNVAEVKNIKAVKQKPPKQERKGMFSKFKGWIYDKVFGHDIFTEYFDNFERKQFDLINTMTILVLESMVFYRKNEIKKDEKEGMVMQNKSQLGLMKLTDQGGFEVTNNLFRMVVSDFENEEETVMLYLLVTENKEFRTFLIQQNPTLFVLPLLKKLYECDPEDEFTHHIWLMVLVLNILSQNESFNVKLNKVMLKSVAWYKDHILEHCSLASLVFLVLSKVIHENLVKKKGKNSYLINNSLGVIGNLSSYSVNIHQYACQRFFFLIRVLVAKHRKLSSIIEKESEKSEDSLILLQSYQSYIETCLDIINSILVTSFPDNLNIGYQLLLEKKLIVKLCKICEEGKPIEQNNLKIFQEFFDKLIKKEEKENQAWSINQIMECLKRGGKIWRNNLLGMKASNSRLAFVYKEADTVEEFFVPFIWSLIIMKSEGIDWETEKEIELSLPIIAGFAKKGTPNNGISSEEDEEESNHENFEDSNEGIYSPINLIGSNETNKQRKLDEDELV